MIYIWTKEGWLTAYAVVGGGWSVETSHNILDAMPFSDYSAAQKVANAIDLAYDSWIMESLPL